MITSVINSDDGLVSETTGLKTTGGDDGNLNIQSNGVHTHSFSGSGALSSATASINVQCGDVTFATKD